MYRQIRSAENAIKSHKCLKMFVLSLNFKALSAAQMELCYAED